MKFDIKKSDIIIDILDLLLGVTIIVVGLLTLHRADIEGNMFPLLFFLGALMLGFNAIRIKKKHKYFALMLTVMAVFLVVSFIVALV